MTTDSKPRSTNGPDVAVLVGEPPLLDASVIEAIAVDALREIGIPGPVELSIHFVDTGEIARLNHEALGRTGPTDVISLPLEPLVPGDWPPVDPVGPPLALGDVFIAPEIVRSRALEHGFDPLADTALMVVHGVLHLAGHDHADDDSAETMESIEDVVLARNGFGRR